MLSPAAAAAAATRQIRAIFLLEGANVPAVPEGLSDSQLDEFVDKVVKAVAPVPWRNPLQSGNYGFFCEQVIHTLTL